jgi:Flp pilus assembly protein TadD
MTKGLGVNPQDDALKVQLCRIYASTGRLPLAIQNLREILQRHSNYSAGYVLLGTLYEQSGSIAEARQAYQKALEIDPNYAPALNNLAWLYCENGGNLDLALSLAQHAKEALPADLSVSDTLGWIEYKKGLYTAAVQQLQDIAQQRPSNALYQYHFGMALSKIGNSSEARESLQRALGENLSSPYVESAKTALAALERKSL